MYTADTAAMVARCLVLLLDHLAAGMRIQKIYVGPKTWKLLSQLETLEEPPTPTTKQG